MVVDCETKNGDRKQLNVSFNIKRCMVDGKLRGILSGRSGAHCFNCDWELKDYWIPNPHRGRVETVSC